MNMDNICFRITAILVLLALIPLTTCSKDSPTKPQAPEPTPPPPTPVATRIDISPSSATFNSIGRTVQLNARVLDQNNSPIINAVVTWTSSNPAVATVNARGLVRSEKNGTAQVSARSGNVVASVTAIVSQKASRVDIEPSRPGTLSIGQTVQITAKVLDENLQPIVGAPVTWISSDEAVTTVSDQGLVTAVGNGTAQITARSGSAQVVTTVTVDTEAITDVNRDRDALIALYHATNGPNWTTSGNWLSEAPLNTWTGVSTNQEGRVSNLVLSDNGLRGSIPPEIGTLTRLQNLEINSNYLVGSIPPEIGGLVRLYYLNLENNALSGSIPTELGNLASLGQLNLSYNQLTGSIPSELGKLAILYVLDLKYNQLTGRVPPNLGQLAELLFLDLNNNQFTGRIPPELGNLTKLDWLRIAHNQLSGSIPHELGNLASLRILGLQGNELSGSIPPELGMLGNLEHLALSSNQLTGSIPSELGNLGKLDVLWLNNNQLKGSVPPELGNLSNLGFLTLSNNPLEGTIPRTFLRLPLYSMGCRGTTGVCLPSTGEFREWARQVEARAVQENVSFPVDIPYCDEIDRQGLAALYVSANGDGWTFSDGWLDDNKSLDRWYGVQIDSIGRVFSLDLNSNGLSGSVPEALGLLASMKELRIGDNELAGRLPPALTAVPLEEFDYTGTALCVADDTDFQDWLEGIRNHTGTEILCPPLTERDILTSLYRNTGGTQWANSTGWLTDAPLSAWYGVETNGVGHVVSLRLRRNGLSSLIPADLGQLAHLRVLDLHGNGLYGSIPAELGNLEWLELLDFGNNQLSGDLPGDLGRLAQLRSLHLYYNRLSGSIPPQLGNLAKLASLNLAGNQFSGSIPVELGTLSVIRNLDLGRNELTGSIPPQLGDLANLASLNLADNQFSGSIPVELGDLSSLTSLDLSRTQVTGPIPEELGALAALEHMLLEENGLTGAIPSALGDLGKLAGLNLANNQLTGPIPSALGDLGNLARLNLANNQLTGPIPSALGGLDNLTDLNLGDNQLTERIPADLGRIGKLESLDLRSNTLSGSVPPEFGNLTLLKQMILADNAGLAGRMPSEIAALDRLELLMAGGTGLCRPADARFDAWFRTIPNRRLVVCEVGASVYLTQTVQSWDDPVPLLAGKPALLRVFVTRSQDGSTTMPDVRATFYVNGAERHTVHIPSSMQSLPSVVDEGNLELSANTEIPDWVIAPGLEMVIEVDPEGVLDPSLGATMRIPESGRLAVDVRYLSPLRLTLVPLLFSEDPDESVVGTVEAMAAAPQDHVLLRDIRMLLPVVEFEVTAREPVTTSTKNSITRLAQLKAMRLMEGGSGYWMGIFDATPGRQPAVSYAYRGGNVSVSLPVASTMAHELGHNLGLGHAPCATTEAIDPWYPHPGGRIGAWGYDIGQHLLVTPGTPDVMSYCGPSVWISDFFFNKALNYRLAQEDDTVLAAAHARTLLVWGGRDENGVPYLDPAFVVDAVPSLPDAGGEYYIEGATADDEVLFSFSFGMPVNPDAVGEEASFVFTLPVQSTWAGNLESITLSGPEGAAVLDSTTNRPMAILQDPVTGQVRAFLSDLPSGGSDWTVSARATVADPALDMHFSRGIPDLR